MNRSLTATILFTAAVFGCQAQSVVKIPVAQNPLFEVSANNVAVSVPDGGAGATLGGDLVISGGSGHYTYRWYDGSDVTLGTESTLSILSPGIYYLDIEDTCECLQTIEFNVTTASIDDPGIAMTAITPNPTDGPVEISGFDAIQISAVSMAGKMEMLLNSPDGISPIHYADFGMLPHGQYLITLTDVQGNTIVRKLLKK
ncbi:MAG: hypothetical protein K2L90_07225 [Muribaculaceae bacterium]|nr:hypothetical protein [Muribaculaceae bacterium]